MQLSDFVNRIALAQNWPLRIDPSGSLRLEVPTQPGRTQIVHIMQGQDAEQDAMVFLWSTAGALIKYVTWPPASRATRRARPGAARWAAAP